MTQYLSLSLSNVLQAFPFDNEGAQFNCNPQLSISSSPSLLPKPPPYQLRYPPKLKLVKETEPPGKSNAMSLPGLELGEPTAATQLAPAAPVQHSLPKGSEWRFEAGFGSTVRVKVCAILCGLPFFEVVGVNLFESRDCGEERGGEKSWALEARSSNSELEAWLLLI